MYNRDEFVNILKECQGTLSLNEYARISDIDVGYLWRIINKKKNNPPSPKILKKIANTSNGITNYEELMQICGYLDLSGLYNINLDDNEKSLLVKILLSYKEHLEKKTNEYFDEEKYLDGLDSSSKEKLIHAFRINSLNLVLNNKNKSTLNNKEFEFISQDDAMFPLLDIGDSALIYKQDNFDKDATYLIKLNNKKTIRRIVESKECYELYPMNPCYKVDKLSKKDFLKLEILGKVIKTENYSAFK